LWQHTP